MDEPTIHHLVQTNVKKRFELFWGYDPSPPRRKKKPTQGKTKKQLQRDREATTAAAAAAAASGTGIEMGQGKGKEPDAAAIDIISSSLASTDLAAPSLSLSANPVPAQGSVRADPPELPLISLPDPHDSDVNANASVNSDGPKGEYFIRATQGHSIQLESTAHLEQVKDDEEGRSKVGLMVHGTRWELWDTLSRFCPQLFTSFLMVKIANLTGCGRKQKNKVSKK